MDLSQPQPATPARITPSAGAASMGAKYSIEGELGRGGMGRVWAVRDSEIGRTVAIKSLEDGTEAPPEDVARFTQEARITGQLEHPSIVPVYEVGATATGEPFFAMKRIDGTSLGEVLFRLRHGDEAFTADYDLAALLRVLLKVCDAVAFAHSRGVIHRDIKPDNVMVGGFGEVLVMDWGVAKVLPGAAIFPAPVPPASTSEGEGTELPIDHGAAARPPDTHARARLDAIPPHESGESTAEFGALRPRPRPVTLEGALVGTPVYVPPEQAGAWLRGQPIPTTTGQDVYALGAILYEIVALRPPYEGQEPYPVLEKIAAGDRPDIPKCRPPGRAIPPALIPIVDAAMARAPADRYPSVNAFAADVQAFLEARRVSVYRESVRAKLGRWARQQPGMFVGSVAALVLLVVTAALSTIAMGQAQQRQDELERRLAAEGAAQTNAVRAWEARQRTHAAERREAVTKEVALLEHLLPSNPSDVVAYSISDPADLAAHCARLLVLRPNHTLARLTRARLALDAGQYRAAEADLTTVINAPAPADAARELLARLRISEGDYARAYDVLTGLPLGPDDATQLRRGRQRIKALVGLGEGQGIHATIDALLDLMPHEASRLAKWRVRWLDQSRAIREGAAPAAIAAMTERADEALQLVRLSQFELALARFSAMIERDARSVLGWYGRACCLVLLGNPSSLHAAKRALLEAWTLGLRACPYDVIDIDPDIGALAADFNAD